MVGLPMGARARATQQESDAWVAPAAARRLRVTTTGTGCHGPPGPGEGQGPCQPPPSLAPSVMPLAPGPWPPNAAFGGPRVSAKIV